MSYQLIRGMRDIGPEATPRWRLVERAIENILDRYSYQQIRLPLLEATELFSRGVGEATDIVEKEMYSMADRDGNSLSLRPEGTASCVRACIQQGLIFNQTRRLWYSGPMFRYERPQKGRYRQFEQIGAEVFGIASPDADAELIQMSAGFWRALGIERRVQLQINTIGSQASRQAYRRALVEFLEPHTAALDEDSRRRLASNPLRILDSKVPSTQDIVAEAPRLHDFLDDEAVAHFDELKKLLDDLQLPYQVNPRLVRGLDYYTHTVFEWVSSDLGAQDAVCAGGRYDGLVERLGGRPTPAAGFALGVDRVVLLHEATVSGDAAACDVYVAVMAPEYMAWAMNVADALRVANIRVRVHTGGGKIKNQMKRADQSGARYAVIIGEDEVAENRLAIKWLREDRPQTSLGVDEAQALFEGGRTDV